MTYTRGDVADAIAYAAAHGVKAQHDPRLSNEANYRTITQRADDAAHAMLATLGFKRCQCCATELTAHGPIPALRFLL
jgi:hypothetical protein